MHLFILFYFIFPFHFSQTFVDPRLILRAMRLVDYLPLMSYERLYNVLKSLFQYMMKKYNLFCRLLQINAYKENT